MSRENTMTLQENMYTCLPYILINKVMFDALFLLTTALHLNCSYQILYQIEALNLNR